MPGLDHDVHPSTIGSERYDACRNKKRADGYWAPDTCYKTHPPKRVWAWVQNCNSHECRYDQSLTDPKCEGCKQRGFGEDYDAKIRSMGT